jgi:replicative DNA helicase
MGDKSRPAFDIVAELRRAVEEIENAAAPEDTGIVTAHDAADLAIAEMEDLARHGRARGAMTGLRCIDRRLNGLLPGAMLVIGGRPGMMKTGLARNIMHGAAVRNPHLLFPFFGLEMGSGEMMQRELASLTQENREGIEYRAMGSGALTALDFQAIKSARQRVPSNLLLADCPSLSIDDVRRRVWALSRKGRLGAIAIDYLQLMRRPPANGRNEASVISEMTQALKQLAREAGICVVLLSQLSRAVEQRDDKRPQPWDLRESGSIEQDADAILFPFREHYYLVKAEPKKSDTDKHLAWEMACEDARYRMEVICAKQRQGPEGTDRQRCFPEYDLIEDEE